MKAHQSGFTLIEVMVAIVLFLVLMLAIMPGILGNQKLNRQTQNGQNIDLYARNVMEVANQAILTPSGTSQDPYPNLTAGVIPAGTVYPAAPTGVSCTQPIVTQVIPVNPDPTVTKVGSRATLSMTCTPTTGTQLVFVHQVVRPS